MTGARDVASVGPILNNSLPSYYVWYAPGFDLWDAKAVVADLFAEYVEPRVS